MAVCETSARGRGGARGEGGICLQATSMLGMHKLLNFDMYGRLWAKGEGHILHSGRFSVLVS